jgi:glycopeptide antibiotics resistance protein
MYRIYNALIEMLAASVFIIPVFMLYEKYIFHKIKRTFTYGIFGFYLVAVFALVGFPNITSLKVEFIVNVIPFVDMISDFVNAGLNIVLFIPLGIFLPVLWNKYRNIKSGMIIAFFVTFIIEISQIFTLRTTDINDIITNMLGALIGFFMAKWVTKNFTRYTNSNANYKDFYIIYITVILIMFLLQPFVSLLLWEIVL